MLVQTPSKIFKNDFREWKMRQKCAVAEIFQSDVALKKMTEIVFEEGQKYEEENCEGKTFGLMPLYGEVILDGYMESISAGEILVFPSKEKILLQNHVVNDRADVLLMEIDAENTAQNFVKTSIDYSQRNSIVKILNQKNIQAFTGIFDGREEGFHTLQNSEKQIFGMVLNGAFEFQNRLLENRDAIVLSEISALEFEALSEDAIVLFFEF